MRAAVLSSPYQLTVSDISLPQPGQGEVLVRLRCTAVCGTDVSIYTGKICISYPRILGHESTGEVAAVGTGVKNVREGDRVILNPIVFCGRCPQCLSGNVNLCENGGLMGREVDGTFAEYVVVPDYQVIGLPASISFEDGTSLVALATVARSHTKIRISPGDSVAVIGLGTVGLMQVQMALMSGANPVYAITRSKWKLDMAERFGAVPISAETDDAVRRVLNSTGGQGADVVIESTGSGMALRQAMYMVRPGGQVLAFGILHGSVDDFSGYAMYFKELTLVGSRGMTPADFRRAIKVVESGKVDISPFITHRFDLADTKDALDLVDKTPGRVLRVTVNVQAS
ncbi:MAG: alcohol dehydrogenase catalytic domain-containing protein [Bacillota bacterium]